MTRLRATRATPPGLAATDEKRKETYGAALQQFDELLVAASTVSPISRPLPLYYAVLQAGKAIAAALAPGDWNKIGHGHGLGEDQNAQAPSWQASILAFRVVPKGNGIFGAVATALGRGRLTGSVEMGALWAALPEVSSPASEDWLPALPVYMTIPSEFIPRGRMYSGLLSNVDFGASASLRSAADVNGMLARYPGAIGAKATTYQGEIMPSPAPSGQCFQVAWGLEPGPADQDDPELIASYVAKRFPRYPRTEALWLLPEVGDGPDRLPPVLLWWVLLHGLSLLARYEPAAWRSALDLDKSPIADPLIDLLDSALQIVPDLLYEAATVPGDACMPNEPA
jgi:hypothetical protein